MATTRSSLCESPFNEQDLLYISAEELEKLKQKCPEWYKSIQNKYPRKGNQRHLIRVPLKGTRRLFHYKNVKPEQFQVHKRIKREEESVPEDMESTKASNQKGSTKNPKLFHSSTKIPPKSTRKTTGARRPTTTESNQGEGEDDTDEEGNNEKVNQENEAVDEEKPQKTKGGSVRTTPRSQRSPLRYYDTTEIENQAKLATPSNGGGGGCMQKFRTYLNINENILQNYLVENY